MSEEQELSLTDEEPLDRRAFLRGSLLVVGGVALGRIPVAAAARPSRELTAFLAVSRIVAGIDKPPVVLARQYLEALNAAPELSVKPAKFLGLAGYTEGSGPRTLRELKRSPAFKARGGKECAEAIAAAWWSGMVPTGGGQRVVTYSDALVWREVHEPMTCQGATGSWAKPGRAVL